MKRTKGERGSLLLSRTDLSTMTAHTVMTAVASAAAAIAGPLTA